MATQGNEKQNGVILDDLIEGRIIDCGGNGDCGIRVVASTLWPNMVDGFTDCGWRELMYLFVMVLAVVVHRGMLPMVGGALWICKMIRAGLCLV